ncbi:MAG: hypothetical protein CVU59_03495, partial [Deltaproteobacteria bacterium HGW-Deltaproteobacteria-17]
MTSKKPEAPHGRARTCARLAIPEVTTHLRLCPVCHRNYPPDTESCEVDGSRLHRVCLAPALPQAGTIVGNFELQSRIAPG